MVWEIINIEVNIQRIAINESVGAMAYNAWINKDGIPIPESIIMSLAVLGREGIELCDYGEKLLQLAGQWGGECRALVIQGFEDLISAPADGDLALIEITAAPTHMSN